MMEIWSQNTTNIINVTTCTKPEYIKIEEMRACSNSGIFLCYALYQCYNAIYMCTLSDHIQPVMKSSY